MKPDALVALSAPGSIDLVSAAKGQTDGETLKRHRKRAGLSPVKGRNTVVAAPRTWSVAELGQAAKGVPEVAFLAACYTFAGAHGHFYRLHDALMVEALRLRRQMGWSMRISGVDGQPRGYLPELCELVLYEEGRPALFIASPGLFATHLRITPDLWEGKVEERYTHLKQAYSLWLSDAWRIMAPRLAEWEGDE